MTPLLSHVFSSNTYKKSPKTSWWRHSCPQTKSVPQTVRGRVIIGFLALSLWTQVKSSECICQNWDEMLSLPSVFSFVLLLFFVSVKATAAYAYQKPESCLALQIKEWIQIHCLRICVKSLCLSCSYITDFLVFTGGSFLLFLIGVQTTSKRRQWRIAPPCWNWAEFLLSFELQGEEKKRLGALAGMSETGLMSAW